MFNGKKAGKATYHTILKMLPDYVAIQLMYLKNFGRLANLKNPKTFNEKVNWRKLYQHDPRFPLFADKLTAKMEVAKIISEEHIIPTLWVGEKPEDIPFETLSFPYVIKSNNGYGDNIFIRTEEDIDKEKIIWNFREQAKAPHFLLTREWGYKDIPNKIIVERMLKTPNEDTPNDYKFFVYHGIVHFVQMDAGRFGDHKMAFFDRSWEKLPFTKGSPQIEKEIPRPTHYKIMIELAEKIGALFDFVRLDFYDLPSGVFFGEATFYPAGGFGIFRPNEWDVKFGEPWIISSPCARS